MKLKILVIEDAAANIESAQAQLAQYEITIVQNMRQFLDVAGGDGELRKKFDVILTDLNLPYGQHSGGPEVPAETSVAGGIAVALRAMQEGVPCAIVSDSNGHRDPLGYLLEQAGCTSGIVSGIRDYVETGLALKVTTRPDWVDAASGTGKDWAAALQKLCAKEDHPIHKILVDANCA